MANIGDLVQVTNNTDQDIIIKWDARDWKIAAHKTSMVLFEAMSHRFGNPFCGESVQQGITQYGQVFYVPSRYEEQQRMSIRWGWHPFDNPEMYPDISVTDEDDNPIYFLVQNPDGSRTQPLAVSTPSQQDQINSLKSQMRMLEATLAANSPELRIPGVPIQSNPDEEMTESVPEDA